MKLISNTPKQSLNKAYLKEKVGRDNIETFKKNFSLLLSKINEQESEEHLKNIISDFLKNTWYKDLHEINTKGRQDLVIHTGKTSKESVGVIIEVKKPSNKNEMISETKPNAKAMHELILYYLRERTEHNNIDTKYLVITNIYEWFIFDEIWFDKNVFRNGKLKKDYENWKLSGHDTKFFYDSIAKPFLDTVSESIPITYFDIRQYETVIKNEEKRDDNKLIALYKILSPVHLLKQPFSNDSNSLDTKFYTELLHIIGLEEVKDGGKKLIKRKEKADTASLLENTIVKLEDKEVLQNIKQLSSYGENRKEQLFNISLELCITWINRVLFLKLLEAQLYKYHKGNKEYLFLNSQAIFDFDELSNLFFQVLAEKQSNRREHIKEKYSKVPYLNSSLFERTELERATFDISALDNRLELPIFTGTVLKEIQGKRKSGNLPVLQYLFDFLEAYDFTSEGKEEIQEENKNLINASVLGLIFEKINGYKDGSFFTPGFVTMYMCKETIRKSVIQKFNERYAIDCDSFDDLKNFVASRFKAKDILEFNTVINELKICDPAVGSGHFLVSALNELIAIKADLGILADEHGIRLAGYEVKIENDELIITYNNNADIFEYSVTNGSVNKETQRIQKTLFHQKETIIENCLFGVDINPNSVKICRLRLWIELLKNAYYKDLDIPTIHGGLELETLPNIDINIKCGNSLISRFSLDADLSKALKTIKWDINAYKGFVHDYHHAANKEEKQGLEKLIDQIKKDFRSEINKNDKKYQDLSKLKGKLLALTSQTNMFGMDAKQKEKFDKEVEDLTKQITKLESEIEEIKNNKIYENAFEWRFEFPEVLDSEGNFVGFDVIIGNPPYMRSREIMGNKEKEFYFNSYETISYQPDLYKLFIEMASNISTSKICFITPSVFLSNDYDKKLREFLLLNYSFSFISTPNDTVFEEANVSITIFLLEKKTLNSDISVLKLSGNIFELKNLIKQSSFEKEDFVINTEITTGDLGLINKIINKGTKLENVFDVKNGIKVRKELLFKNKINEEYKPFSLGKDVKQLGRLDSTYYIHYTKENEKLYTNQAFRNANVFEVTKVVIRQIPGKNKLIGTFDEDNIYTDQTIYNISSLSKNTPAEKQLLAILTSKLMFYFFKNTSFDNKDLFPKIKRSQLLTFPIVISIDIDIINKIDAIISIKKENNNEEPISLENEIDQLVYNLYELTEEEINIIENN